MAVLMWEACSYGTLPFSSLINNNDIIHCKLRGDHLPRPKICDEDLWLTIVHCWRLEPEERPTFKELRRAVMRLVHRSDSTASSPVLEAAKMSSNEQMSSDNFEVLEEKIPCEYCDELINFDEYIIHTQVCGNQENQQVIDNDSMHGAFIVKHLTKGIIVPALPENDSSIVPSNSIERRRAQLERYLNRLVRNKSLICDPCFLLFFEQFEGLPKTANNLWRSLLTASTTKAQEGDWFDEKYQREQSNAASKALACSLNHLAVCEEYTLLSSAFIELATVQEQLEQVNSERTEEEFLLMNELLNEYLLHLDMVKYAFNERAKVHKRWLTTVDTFQKKQLKMGPHFEMEMLDLEKKITDDMQDYQQISMTLKQELEIFDQNRTEEFKNNIHAYIAQTLIQQEKVLNIWETYLPIANNIDVTN
ncbi:unnamed protein product [Adineta steineri]|uniref:Uncharacterized protein n=2 Tax=Adineta steineri TaxID=433720 RepID=A0A819M615_9BILA|nr:unnamed protein product [Adineta steineri]